MGNCMVFKNHRRGWCQWNKPQAYELHLNRAHEMFEPAKISSGITVFGLFSELFLLPKLWDFSFRFFRYGIFRVALLFICQGTNSFLNELIARSAFWQARLLFFIFLSDSLLRLPQLSRFVNSFFSFFWNLFWFLSVVSVFLNNEIEYSIPFYSCQH